jgi:hypothetical protein
MFYSPNLSHHVTWQVHTQISEEHDVSFLGVSVKFQVDADGDTFDYTLWLYRRWHFYKLVSPLYCVAFLLVLTGPFSLPPPLVMIIPTSSKLSKQSKLTFTPDHFKVNNEKISRVYYNEKFLSIKSGCYNEQRCYKERGGILSADVARACA